jgi:hypothetical protein
MPNVNGKKFPYTSAGMAAAKKAAAKKPGSLTKKPIGPKPPPMNKPVIKKPGFVGTPVVKPTSASKKSLSSVNAAVNAARGGGLNQPRNVNSKKK